MVKPSVRSGTSSQGSTPKKTPQDWQRYIPPLGTAANGTQPLGDASEHINQVKPSPKLPKTPNSFKSAPSSPIPASPRATNTNMTRQTRSNNTSQTSNAVDSRKATPLTTTSNTCEKCGGPIIGTLVRAMDHVYHIECFTCHDCGKQCSDKFFAEDLPGIGTVPLCEYDYFRRIDLICFTCDNAIRGAYITAIGHKYHPEHFYCNVCHKVFETEDYYEHGGKIYCHYHYSKVHASHCQACGAAILKQYVEMHRGGKEQQWHPECFMIHKFWGVNVTTDCIGLTPEKQGKDLPPAVLFDIERRVERMTMSIWLTLSEFEESCASCISDMLHAATTNNKQQGLLAAGRIVLKIECLFKGVDVINDQAKSSHIHIDYDNPRFQHMSPLTKEPRSLSSKLMTYLALLRDVDPSTLSSPDYSRQLLSLISTLAHYIKLISRSSLMHALEYNRLTSSTGPTDKYLKEISLHDSIPLDVFPLDVDSHARDLCVACGDSIEAQCYRLGGLRWHPGCFICSNCHKNMANSALLAEAAYDKASDSLLCDSCSSGCPTATTGFELVSRYEELIYLLKIALNRTRHAMKKRGVLFNTSSALGEDDSYTQQVTDVKRMRSLRQDRKVGTATNEIRKSVILQAPEAASSSMEDTDSSPAFVKTHKSLGRKGSKKLRIADVPMDSSPANIDLGATSELLKNEKGLTLDDIPRIVSSEQAREYRPNAFRFQKRNYESATSTMPVTKEVITRTQPVEPAETTESGVVRFSELSSREFEVMRHVAAFALHEALGNELSLDDCISFVDARKSPSIWGRLFGSKKSSPGNGKIFGVPLDVVDTNYGVDSDLGIGPEKLRIPMLIDELINVMHTKDLSAEGVFRLNGNIRRLKKLIAEVDSHPNTVPDLYTENPIQLAALLKRYCRDMPNPLLTFRLYDLFVLSHKYPEGSEKRDLILKMAYAMLPKAHRDLTEVLFAFLNWVATFSQIDKDTGSKMDTHNLATVLTPNILYADPKNMTPEENAAALLPSGENHFLSIEVISTMIEDHNELSIVPKYLLQLYEEAGLKDASEKMTTKEIIAKCRAACDNNADILM